MILYYPSLRFVNEINYEQYQNVSTFFVHLTHNILYATMVSFQRVGWGA